MMKKNETEALAETIALLKEKQALELKLLREQFQLSCESVKPANLVKSAWHEITSSPEIKNNIAGNVIGMATGYLSKKVLVGSSLNPIKRLLGGLLQFAIGNVVSNHSDTLVSAGGNILSRFLKFRKEVRQEYADNET